MDEMAIATLVICLPDMQGLWLGGCNFYAGILHLGNGFVDVAKLEVYAPAGGEVEGGGEAFGDGVQGCEFYAVVGG